MLPDRDTLAKMLYDTMRATHPDEYVADFDLNGGEYVCVDGRFDLKKLADALIERLEPKS